MCQSTDFMLKAEVRHAPLSGQEAEITRREPSENRTKNQYTEEPLPEGDIHPFKWEEGITSNQNLCSDTKWAWLANGGGVVV